MRVARELSYTALFEEVEGGWTQARIAEIPGVITAGPSRDEQKSCWEMLSGSISELYGAQLWT